MLDGGFVTKKLQEKLGHFPVAKEVQAECLRIAAHDQLKGRDLLRIYFYDAEPATVKVKNPLDGSVINLSLTPEYAAHRSLLDTLELTPFFAIRRGEVVSQGWKLGRYALASIAKKARPLAPRDIVPDLKQKGVDLRIGLDMARLALCKLVDIVVVTTGDSDLVPAFKFARREGVRVFLDHMGHGVRRELKAHADLIL